MYSKELLLEKGKLYLKLQPAQKLAFLQEVYVDYSYAEIAAAAHTYPNRIARDARKLGLPARSKSDAQKKALETGRHPHPTKGSQRPDSTRVKISEGKAEAWHNLDANEKARLADISRGQWNSMSDLEKKEFHRRAGEAIRLAAKEGSQLEKYLHLALIKAGYRAELHKEHLIVNERLHIDLFLPTISVAIEVDGPSHFLPIWGDKTLRRNQRSDSEKAGLILGQGFVLIRIKHSKALSQKYKRDIAEVLVNTLKDIEDDFPDVGDRYIELGEDL